MTVPDARAVYHSAVAEHGIAAEPVADITERTIPGPGGDIPVRIYTPEGSKPLPVLVYFHGGGWMLGNLDVVHGPCTVLANRAYAIVVSVDYRPAQMLHELSQGQAPESLVSLIFEESQGNPFFVEEVYRHLVEDGKVF
jgi:acetyl esterase/lipase